MTKKVQYGANGLMPSIGMAPGVCVAREERAFRGLHEHDLERWGAGVETQKNVRGEVGGWGRVPFNEPYAPSLSTIYDGA